MISKLPRWVEVGGFWLACIAGAANSIGLLGFTHQAVSHLSATSTLLGVSLVEGRLAETAHLLGIVLSFVVGAAGAGAILGNVALKLGRQYSFVLVIESLLLLMAMVALVQDSGLGHFLASAACGLQNGMVSTYSGAVVRTTHVTGLFTDLGTMLGAALRGHPLNTRQATLFLVLIAGFIAGGGVGAILFRWVQFYALLFPAAGAGALAVSYWVFRLRRRAKQV